MKIVHLELEGFYNENMSYQTNLLVEEHCKDGHEVLVISKNYQFLQGEVVRVEPGRKMLPCGAVLERKCSIPNFKDHRLQKIRMVRGIYQSLEEFKPDVILSHGLAYWSIFDVIRYKKDHLEVKLYADTHAAHYNSGTNWFSLHIQHRIFYRYLVQKALPYLEKYFYIGQGEKEFSLQHYGIPESLMEFYPLGGTLFPQEIYEEKRKRRRAELGIAPDELLLIHTGKMGPLKRTAELLRAFSAAPGLRARLIVIGSIPEETKGAILPLVEEDSRIEYLGWKNADELMEYLCACDLYCQPGSVSATMQNAVCCGCPVLSYPHEAYTGELDYGEFFWARTQEEIQAVFSNLAAEPAALEPMTQAAWRCARELLDYRKLAARLYQ